MAQPRSKPFVAIPKKAEASDVDFSLFPPGMDAHMIRAVNELLKSDTLDVSGLDNESARTMVRAQRLNSNLKYLTLKDCDMGNGGMLDLIAMLDTCTAMTKLVLPGCRFTPAAAKCLIRALKKHPPGTLKALSLARNEIGDVGCTALADFLQHPTGAALETLDLSQRATPSNAGLVAIGQVIQAGGGRALTEVCFAQVGMDDAAALSLGAGLAKVPGLTHLDVSRNAITPLGITRVAECVKPTAVPRVASLMVNHNPLDDDGVGKVLTALRGNTSLRRLHLSETRAALPTAAALRDVLASHPVLIDLRLDANFFDCTAVEALATGLATSPALIGLSLDDCPFADAGASALARALTTNTSLTMLTLGRACATRVSGFAFADALRTNTTLQFLSFRATLMDDVGASALRDVMASGENQSLLDMSVADTFVSPPMVDELRPLLTANMQAAMRFARRSSMLRLLTMKH